MDLDSSVDLLVRKLQAEGAPIQESPNQTLVQKLEFESGLKFPDVFASFISRYSFPLLEFEHSELFGNNGKGEYDLTSTPFRDPAMSTWLLRKNLFHIGFPCIGDYNPICLDLFDSPTIDSTVVKLNHEDILLGRDVRVEMLSESLLSFLGDQHVA